MEIFILRLQIKMLYLHKMISLYLIVAEKHLVCNIYFPLKTWVMTTRYCIIFRIRYGVPFRVTREVGREIEKVVGELE